MIASGQGETPPTATVGPPLSFSFVLGIGANGRAAVASAGPVMATSFSMSSLLSDVMKGPSAEASGATVTTGRRIGARLRGQGANGVRVGLRQPAPGGATGGPLQLQRRGRPGTNVGATETARHQAAGAAAARQGGWSSRPNPRRDSSRSRLGRDSTAKASPFRVAEARLRAAHPIGVGPIGVARDATHRRGEAPLVEANAREGLQEERDKHESPGAGPLPKSAPLQHAVGEAAHHPVVAHQVPRPRIVLPVPTRVAAR